MAKRFSTPFVAASAAARGGYAFSPVSSQPAAWIRERSESASGGPVSLPVVRPRLPFYGLRRGTPGAEAGYHRPVGAAQDPHVWVRVVQSVAGRQAQFPGG